MERKKASDFPQELLDLLHYYVHGDIGRREFLNRAQKFAVGGVTAAALFDMLKPNYAFANQVAEDDKRITSQTVSIPSPEGNGRIDGYLVRPAGSGKLPAIMVVHENRGLNPYIKDVARRVALEGYMALAPDGLTSVGGDPPGAPADPRDDEKGVALFKTVDPAKMRQDFFAAAAWLQARPDSTGKLGATGFCFGGGIVNQLAVHMGSELAAGVPFYGEAPTPEEAARIKAPINAQYAELDTRITAGAAAYDAELAKDGVPHEMHIYKGANHGFFNDTTPRYDEAASKEAWGHTLDWFTKYVKA
jgi:carboxymethylenebutenolidase